MCEETEKMCGWGTTKNSEVREHEGTEVGGGCSRRRGCR